MKKYRIVKTDMLRTYNIKVKRVYNIYVKYGGEFILLDKYGLSFSLPEARSLIKKLMSSDAPSTIV